MSKFSVGVCVEKAFWIEGCVMVAVEQRHGFTQFQCSSSPALHADAPWHSQSERQKYKQTGGGEEEERVCLLEEPTCLLAVALAAVNGGLGCMRSVTLQTHTA
ncbi:hypothetical protein NQZ68_003507 [Dissostichus eleginoides]|nr:hypothetical protein NQZ68_003507 [Dissostichus eleginoides]